MENKKCYAVQLSTSDGWDNGSYDFEEAKAMLKKQGRGLIAVIDDDYCEEEIWFDDLYDLDDFDDDELAEYVAEADAWDEYGVVERMKILAHRANRELWKMYKSGLDGNVDVSMTWAEDILSWINYDDENSDWDEKVWKAGEVLEELASGDSSRTSNEMAWNYEGWPSIARYIQTILDVDLGI